MKVKNKRAEMISAVRCYFRLGLASQRLSYFDAVDRIRGSFGARSKRACQLVAVHELLRFLRAEGREDMIDLICYLARRQSTGKSGLLFYSMAHYFDERTVYRHIAYLTKLYERLLSL